MERKESLWIKKLNTLQPNGYNIGFGGEGGDTISNHPDREKIIKKISIATTKEKNPFWKKKHTSEAIEKNRNANKELYEHGYINPFQGRHHTNKTKELIHNKLVKKYADGYVNPNMGIKHSKETREKMSNNHWNCSGSNNPNWKEKVDVVCIYCKTVKKVSSSRAKKFKFCSRKCSDKGRGKL